MAESEDAKDYQNLVEFLALAVLAAIPLRILFGMDPAQLNASHFGLVTVAIAGMLLFPARNRLRELTINPTGVSAKLHEQKQEALTQIAHAAGPDVAEAVKPRLEMARSPEAIDAIRHTALAVGRRKDDALRNMDAIFEAIRDRKKLRLEYGDAAGGSPIRAIVVPRDLRSVEAGDAPGRGVLRVESEGISQSLPLDRVVRAEVLNEPVGPS